MISSQSKLLHPGLRGRLFLAFGTLSLLTLVVTLVGWLSHRHLGSELDRVVNENIQALGLMAELKGMGTTITTMAPTLVAAEDEQTRQLRKAALDSNIELMVELLPRLAGVIHGSASREPFLEQINSLKQILAHLDSNVSDRLEITQDKLSENRRLRWVSTGFLDSIDNLIQGVEKNLESQFNQDLRKAGIVPGSVPHVTIHDLRDDLQILFRIKADVNLLVSLVDRAQHLPDLSSLIATRVHSEEILRRIEEDIVRVDRVSGVKELRQTLVNIVYLTRGNNNMFSIRRQERTVVEQGKDLLDRVNDNLEGLNRLVATQVGITEAAARNAADEAQRTVRNGQRWMIAVALVSLLFSIVIVWVYVGRNVVARITRLDSSMRAIAGGNLEQSVPTSGSDEIAAMGQSLLSFRDQLTDLREELVRTGKLAALGELSAGIAHEINQPLSAIGHYSHNGLKLIQSGRTGETEDNLKQISDATRRARDIITRLKSMSRNQEEHRAEVDLHKIVDAVLGMMEGDKVFKRVKLDVVFETSENRVMADPIPLEQVLLNLMTNARDAIADLADPRIGIECRHDGGFVVLQVRDNGPGVDFDLRGRIFDPFFTTKRLGQNLGLGLSISYNIIQNFGGKLEVEASEEGGACFSIRLPALIRGGA